MVTINQIQSFAEALSVYNQSIERTYGEKIIVKEKPKYYYINEDGSGKYLVDKSTGYVWSIKGYGVKNRIVDDIQSFTSKLKQQADSSKFTPKVIFEGDKNQIKFSAIGKIFTYSYGYDMTINEYVQVVAETTTQCTVVKLKRSISNDNGLGGGSSVPVPNTQVGRPFTLLKRIGYNGEMVLKGADKSEERFDRDSHTWSLWDGKANYYNTWD